MKTLQKYFAYFILISDVIFFISCSKSATENKIVGTWQLVDVTNIYDSIKENWEFGSDGRLLIIEEKNGLPDAKPKSIIGYEVKSYKKVELYDIDTATVYYYYGTWEIKKLKKDEMIIFLDNGGIQTREFVKL